MTRLLRFWMAACEFGFCYWASGNTTTLKSFSRYIISARWWQRWLVASEFQGFRFGKSGIRVFGSGLGLQFTYLWLRLLISAVGQHRE